jgi:hypothetical protein
MLLEIQPSGTEFLDAETGGQKSALETADVHRDGKFGEDTGEIPAKTASLESTTKCAVWEDWMVETIWTKLPAPHAGIEPVSELRARNGIFCCRDGSAKSAVRPLRDRYRDAQRFEKPPFWRD